MSALSDLDSVEQAVESLAAQGVRICASTVQEQVPALSLPTVTKALVSMQKDGLLVQSGMHDEWVAYEVVR